VFLGLTEAYTGSVYITKLHITRLVWSCQNVASSRSSIIASNCDMAVVRLVV